MPGDLFGLGKLETHIDISLPDENERLMILGTLLETMDTHEDIDQKSIAV